MQATGIDATELSVTLHGGSATGVEIIEPNPGLKETKGVHDLQGRKLLQGNKVTKSQSNELPKGVYIMNGKKIIK